MWGASTNSYIGVYLNFSAISVGRQRRMALGAAYSFDGSTLSREEEAKR